MNFLVPRNQLDLMRMIEQEIKLQGVNANLNHIDVSLIVDFEGVFNPKKYPFTHGFNGDISEWITSAGVNMTGMFKYSCFNGDLSNWDVSNVRSMEKMFMHAQFNQGISNWKISKVNDARYMFAFSGFNQSLNDWDVSQIKTFCGMFEGSDFNQPLSQWRFGSVVDTQGMFQDSLFEEDLPVEHLKASVHTEFESMFGRSLMSRKIKDWLRKKGHEGGKITWDHYRAYRWERALNVSLTEDEGLAEPPVKKRL